MNETELRRALDEVEDVARKAGALVLAGYRGQTQVHKKGRVDLLTEYDLRSEELVRGRLGQAFPGMQVVGEESDGPGVTGSDDALTWYVDPIDGTTNFVHGHPFFCVSIGLCRGGAPLLGVIFAPALDVCWRGAVGQGATRNGAECRVSGRDQLDDSLCATGFPYDRASSDENNFREFLHFKTRTRGVRRCGSAALDLALTADGTYDAYWEFKLNPWDFAGGAALVLAAGGQVTSDTGGPVDLRTGALIASNGVLHDAMVEQLRSVRQGRPFPERKPQPSSGGENDMDEAQRDAAHRARMQELKAAQDAERRTKTIKRGVIVVNTGDGKGKSTSGFGVAIRAAGHGQRVGLVQFIKGTWKTGEQAALKRFPEIDHVVSGDGFTWNTQDRQQDVASARRGWEAVVDMLEASRGPEPKYDVLVLDELNIVLGYDYLPVDEVVQALKNKPEALSIVITGRGAKPELVEIADTVTEMRPIKHAYASGIAARRGVEF